MTIAGTIPAVATAFTAENTGIALAERARIIERLAAHPSGVALLPGTG